MTEQDATILVTATATHDRVAIVINDDAIGYGPYDALKIAAEILDSVIGCDPDELTPITFTGLPRIGVTAEQARTIAKSIATTADRLLDEADVKF